MKTLEQIKERIESNTYHESDMDYIMGYLLAKGIELDHFEFDTPESSDDRDDFIEWFESEEAELNEISKETINKINDAYECLIKEIKDKYPNLKISFEEFRIPFSFK